MKKLNELVSNNNLNKALNYLLSNYSIDKEGKNNIYNLLGQLTEIEKKELLNTANSEEIGIKKNRIREAILIFGDKFKQTSREHSNTKNSSFDFNFERFIGLGNEPGWSLKISKKNIIFVSDYGEKTHAYEITKSFLGKDIWHFRSYKPVRFGKPLFNGQMYISITITKEIWKDDMSGFEYPFRVEITENFRHYIGVGQIQTHE